MGFNTRTASITRYRVDGTIEGSFWDAVDSGVHAGAFKDGTNGDRRGFGWVSSQDFTDTSFAGTSYVHDDLIALSLRIDTVKVPGRLIELKLRERTKEVLEVTGQRRLSVAQRRELKDQIKEALSSQALLNIQVHDLVWNTGESVVYLASLSQQVREDVQSHFKTCFGIKIVPLIPYSRAVEMMPAADRHRLEALSPTMFR